MSAYFRNLLAAGCLALAVAACSGQGQPAPTPGPLSTATAIPTPTVTPTPTATPTPTPPPTVDLDCRVERTHELIERNVGFAALSILGSRRGSVSTVMCAPDGVEKRIYFVGRLDEVMLEEGASYRITFYQNPNLGLYDGFPAKKPEPLATPSPSK